MDRPPHSSLAGYQLKLAPGASIGQPEYEHHSSDSLGFIIPLLLALLESVALSIIWWRHWQDAKKPKVEEAPQEVDNVSLCRFGKGPFKYRMIFRLGYPTAAFNCEKAFIDFELLGLAGERQGDLCRMDLSKLPNQTYGEVNCRIQRLNELPPFLGIRAHHSDPNGTIFLYDYQLVNKKTGATMEVRVFNVHLTNVPTVYRGEALGEDALGEGYYPEVPTSPWNHLEVALLAIFAIANISVMVSSLEYFNFLYPTRYRSQMYHRRGHLYRSLLDIVIVAPLMGILMTVVILPFKYTLKKALHREKYAIVPGDVSDNLQTCSKLVYAFLLAFSLVGAGGSIALGVYFTFTKSVFVWSGTLIVGVCIFGCWASGSQSAFINQALETSNQALAPPDNLHGHSQLASPYYTPPSHTDQQGTVLFAPSLQKMKNTDNGESFLGTFLFGPKMMGPKMGKHSLGPTRKASALVRCPKGSGTSLKTIGKRVASHRRISPGIPPGVPLRRHNQKVAPGLGQPTLHKLSGRQDTFHASLKQARTSPALKRPTASPRPALIGRKTSKRSLKR